ncbi:MotE family protein [Oceanobacillus halophilus]|uniref:Magnesium transporter MgtE intracellular domain-containing protein n=1 Tax=Oceanobacillus halophilus TaxID=930130 RepID=A0A495ABW8_9BACI|nr:hypothetical protein [Oceanobacillus halophilus]RKQ37486.1 hypothetical protein D8M06_01380 [Oceanobacillus halophilus]
MTEKIKDRKKKSNPFLWFLFAIAIPMAIVVSLVMIILNVAGFDIVDWAAQKGKNIPVVANVLTDEGETVEVEDMERRLQETIETKNMEIDQLSQNVSELESVIRDLEQEILVLEQNEQSASEEESTEQHDLAKTIAKTYEEMDSEQAALILESMEDRTSVVSILNKLSNEVRGEILQEMNPETAADLTLRLLSTTD